jgi:hypothetical protein
MGEETAMNPMDDATQSETVHANPLAAWQYLCEHGGIELKRRDDTLQEELRVLLDAKQETVEAALSTATMESFVAAFFHLIQPFVSIFRDILAFFEQAGATEGQGQWVLKVDEIDIDLEHFRKWIERLTPAGRVTHHVPAVDYRTVWTLWEVLRRREAINEEVSKSSAGWDRNFDPRRLNLPEDVQEWAGAYAAG